MADRKKRPDFKTIKDIGNRLENELLEREKENERVRAELKKDDTDESFEDFLKKAFSADMQSSDPSSFLTKEELSRLKRIYSKQTEKMPPKPRKRPTPKEQKEARKPREPKLGHGGMAIKKPEMMKGGMYKGKKHMYAAGGMVKEIKM